MKEHCAIYRTELRNVIVVLIRELNKGKGITVCVVYVKNRNTLLRELRYIFGRFISE